MSERVDCGNFVTGFFIGAAIASMAAVLLAPRSGRELRRDIAEGGEKPSETTSHTVAELKASTRDTRESFGRAREALAGAAEGLREATRTMAGKNA